MDKHRAVNTFCEENQNSTARQRCCLRNRTEALSMCCITAVAVLITEEYVQVSLFLYSLAALNCVSKLLFGIKYAVFNLLLEPILFRVGVHRCFQKNVSPVPAVVHRINAVIVLSFLTIAIYLTHINHPYYFVPGLIVCTFLFVAGAIGVCVTGLLYSLSLLLFNKVAGDQKQQEKLLNESYPFGMVIFGVVVIVGGIAEMSMMFLGLALLNLFDLATKHRIPIVRIFALFVPKRAKLWLKDVRLCSVSVPPPLVMKLQSVVIAGFCAVIFIMMLYDIGNYWIPTAMLASVLSVAGLVGLCPIALAYAVLIKKNIICGHAKLSSCSQHKENDEGQGADLKP